MRMFIFSCFKKCNFEMISKILPILFTIVTLHLKVMKVTLEKFTKFLVI